MLKQLMPAIASNDDIKTKLCDLIFSGKLSHAYIIEGKKGSGRHLMAKTIAKSLSCLNIESPDCPLPCDSCENCRKIENNLCPDVIFIKPEEDKQSIGVDAARFLKANVAIVPSELNCKIYIIEDADHMTNQAQNALLLTLEEPPRYVFIFLICEKAGALLTTVRSRAPILRTEQLPDKTVSDHLCNFAPEEFSAAARLLKNKSPNEFAETVKIADGSIGRAYELLDREKREAIMNKRRLAQKIVELALSAPDKSELIESLNILLSKKRDELFEYFNAIRLALRDLIVLKRSEAAPLCFFSDREKALDLSSIKTTTYLLNFMEACDKAIDALSRNANVKLTISVFLGSI